MKESYLMIIIYLQVTGSPSCGREIIAIVADDTWRILVFAMY